MVTHLNIAAFCYSYTCAGDGEVSGLVLIVLPSIERRKPHGSIYHIVERLLGVVMFFLASTFSRYLAVCA